MASSITRMVTVAPAMMSSERSLAVAFLKELAHVAPDVFRDEALDPPLGYSDQHDGLVVLVKHRAGNRALGVEPDEEVDGLAGIPYRACNDRC